MGKAEILKLLENKKLNIDLMKQIFDVPSPSGFGGGYLRCGILLRKGRQNGHSIQQ